MDEDGDFKIYEPDDGRDQGLIAHHARADWSGRCGRLLPRSRKAARREDKSGEDSRLAHAVGAGLGRATPSAY